MTVDKVTKSGITVAEAMDAHLGKLYPPVAISNCYTCQSDTNVTVRCHDRTFKNVTVVDDGTGQTLLLVESKGASSFSWRRTIIDPSNGPLFDLRHFGYAMKNDWAVENRDGQRVCSLKHVGLLHKERSAINAVVHRNAADPEHNDVNVELRPKDRSALTTIVEIEGAEVAEIQLTAANDVTDLEGKGLDRTVWRARVVKGMDLTLVSLTL